MKNNNIRGILHLCTAVNEKAIHIYTRLYQEEGNEDLKGIWGQMAEEEQINADFWNTAKETERQYRFSSIFDHPGKAKTKLETVERKIDRLLTRWEDKNTLENALILAYQVEYTMLDPTFELLLRAVNPLAGVIGQSDRYDRHVRRFIDMFIRYGSITPELELLGETLQSLWQRNKALIKLAMIDRLTGLLNRRGFLIIAEELLYLAHRKKDRIAVLMIDIDDFKQINDQYGHPKGDEVLKAVAKSLKTNVRKSDVLCRYGGDEFVILFPDIRSSAVSRMAEKIRKGVEKARPKGIAVTISIGIEQGVIGDDSDNFFSSWISKADEYLYEAKANGKKCVVSGL